MQTANYQCPSCSNKYSNRFLKCPECDIELKETATNNVNNSGNINQSAGVIGNGNTVYGDISVSQQNTVAEYKLNHLTRFKTLQELIWKILKLALGALGVGALKLINGWEILLKAIGVSQNTAQDIQMYVFLSACVFFICGLSFISFLLIKVGIQGGVRIVGMAFIRNRDKSVDVSEINGKCPIEGCPGTLNLQILKPNEEGIQLAAVCSKHGERHMFEFNDETLKGSRIEKVTFKFKNK